MGLIVTPLTGLSGGLSDYLRRVGCELMAAQIQMPIIYPHTLVTQVYHTGGSFQFLEQAYPRYQPSGHPFGVCLAGGGPRAMRLALGQMRGLHVLGLLDEIGAISCVSGGGWFGTIFTNAPSYFDDETLLGPILEPEEITPGQSG